MYIWSAQHYYTSLQQATWTADYCRWDGQIATDRIIHSPRQICRGYTRIKSLTIHALRQPFPVPLRWPPGSSTVELGRFGPDLAFCSPPYWPHLQSWSRLWINARRSALAPICTADSIQDICPGLAQPFRPRPCISS